ncbi:50S ribosomal protein L10 [Wohlfahrtiimonas chitiniclastica]|uniref:Large ribosomal subunit protein uL10 n=2 Tax=Wohlfahrtiimonas chitiniclastica TaxID=400946 RepID=L8XWS4_9GAMM|nr:50S ribosomal protein L10 [Wohlfahrtiimonas chitiniclastica]ELV08357.1 50S ribosomal protein L10 [Wohlfahrtiimonas chitiniclastica SH04]KZS23286.1 50S ribosomal protein L10 [Wohlfahrtiimonas chitiniclastica]KZX37375.1 50S ribosomal protein L10 [Wohlfahrtiimonas chitiniclastica]MBS7814191.1 50S ribosomal protein L10 [Wohlfahrtiimonas chitiniclastica]MBS7816731.1 50S ribosomal protein L10 [Wohlfahrtiimonas chitiniclastica]
MLTLQEKQAVVAEVSEIASRAHSLVAAEYRGLTVAQLTALREKARAGDVYLRVIKNSLAKRALANSNFESINDHLVGPIILAFSMDEEDPVSGVRAIHEFLKDKANEKMAVKAIVHDGALYEGSELERIASLPTKDQAISMFLAVLKAPVQKLAATLAAVRDQKEAA